MQQQCLIIIELPNGNLEITATPEGIECINDYCDREPDYIWGELLESYSTNGSYQMISPEHIAALTEAPIISINHSWGDQGEFEPYPDNKIWWLENYMVFDEITALRNGEAVIFQAASENSKATKDVEVATFQASNDAWDDSTQEIEAMAIWNENKHRELLANPDMKIIAVHGDAILAVDEATGKAHYCYFVDTDTSMHLHMLN